MIVEAGQQKGIPVVAVVTIELPQLVVDHVREVGNLFRVSDSVQVEKE